jgi:hypothetical protein
MEIEPKKALKIYAQVKAPLRDAPALNSTRIVIGSALKLIFPHVTFWSGGRTKKNRISQGYPKDHWIDATCVGESGEKVKIDNNFIPLILTAQSRGIRQMCRVNKFGF